MSAIGAQDGVLSLISGVLEPKYKAPYVTHTRDLHGLPATQ